MYRIVTGDLPRFVDRDPELARTLHKLRSAGKKLFLLTNSPWSYTETMMTYLLGGAMPEYPTWRHYFEVVICAAGKPSWFKEGRPLMERDGDVLRTVRPPLERGSLYEGGNLHEFERLVGVRGSNVLYVGDHIYGDILRSKKESSWRTAMIIQELDAEIAAYESCRADMGRQRQLDEGRDHLEDELRFYQQRYKELTRHSTNGSSVDAERLRVKRALERVRGELRHNEREHMAIEERTDQRFQPYWGSLLKEGERDEHVRAPGRALCGRLHTPRVVFSALLPAAIFPLAPRSDASRAVDNRQHSRAVVSRQHSPSCSSAGSTRPCSQGAKIHAS